MVLQSALHTLTVPVDVMEIFMPQLLSYLINNPDLMFSTTSTLCMIT
jgi:hypothetical protein